MDSVHITISLPRHIVDLITDTSEKYLGKQKRSALIAMLVKSGWNETINFLENGSNIKSTLGATQQGTQPALPNTHRPPHPGGDQTHSGAWAADVPAPEGAGKDLNITEGQYSLSEGGFNEGDSVLFGGYPFQVQNFYHTSNGVVACIERNEQKRLVPITQISPAQPAKKCACNKHMEEGFCVRCGDTDHSPEVGKKGEGIETLAERNRREDYLTDEEFDQVFSTSKPTE